MKKRKQDILAYLPKNPDSVYLTPRLLLIAHQFTGLLEAIEEAEASATAEILQEKLFWISRDFPLAIDEVAGVRSRWANREVGQ